MPARNSQVGSPKQIGDILFGKMGLPGAKKTPSGQWATPATLLEELAQAGHALPKKILEWRQLAKLKSTYTDSLQEPCRPGDRPGPHLVLAGRHHHGPAVLLRAEPAEHPDPHRGGPPHPPGLRGGARQPADLGRLQPDRAAAPRPHRRHPAAAQGVRGRHRHPRGDRSARCSACRSTEMTPDLRRRAKTINFGIIYGISAFGLADRLGIGREEAVGVHQAVFRALPGHPRLYRRHQAALPGQGLRHHPVRPGLPLPADPLEQPVRARQRRAPGDQRPDPGLGRRHHPPGDDPDGGRRSPAERLNVRMLLQVHDELVFEAARGRGRARAIPIIRGVMEEAPAPALTLRVPLVVEARAAGNWQEAH